MRTTRFPDCTLYEFESDSDPGTWHKCRAYKDGRITCTCRGFRNPRKCWHYNQVADLVQREGKTALAVDAAPVAEAPTSLDVARRYGYVQPMLAQPMADGETFADYEKRAGKRGGWWMEPKFNGRRVIVAIGEKERDRWPTITAWSRPQAGNGPVGNLRELPPHITRILRAFPECTLDGELIVPGGNHSSVAESANEAAQRLVLFDVLRMDGEDTYPRSAAWRRERLDVIGNTLTAGHVTAVLVAPKLEISAKVVKEIWAKGGEGVILKRAVAAYLPGKRSTDWIKVKRDGHATLRITGFKKGEFGPCSVVLLKGCIRGKTIETRVKARNAAWRARFEKDPQAWIGKQLRIEHKGILASGKPEHPVFDHVVED